MTRPGIDSAISKKIYTFQLEYGGQYGGVPTECVEGKSQIMFGYSRSFRL